MAEELKQTKDRALFDFWDRLCSIPRYAFLLSKAGNSVQKAEGLGNWIDRDEAMAVVGDAQEEINVLRQDCATMIAELEDLYAQLPTSQGGEAVGEVRALSGGKQYAALYTMAGQHLVGEKLYTHPADQVADDLTMVKVSRELLQDLRDLAFDQVEHHRAAMGAYKQTRQSAMDSVLAQADALLRS